MRAERDLLGMASPGGLGGIANPLLDPLFMRPPIGLDINGIPINHNLFGGHHHIAPP